MNSKDFKLSSILSDHFKIGTLVYFKDNSWVTNEKAEKDWPTLNDKGIDDIYKIIDGNKPFPTADLSEEIIGRINNIKVINIKTGVMYHCSGINLVSIEHAHKWDNDVDLGTEVIYKGESRLKADLFKNPYPYL